MSKVLGRRIGHDLFTVAIPRLRLATPQILPQRLCQALRALILLLAHCNNSKQIDAFGASPP